MSRRGRDRPFAVDVAVARLARAFRQRCTCIDRDPRQGILAEHEPDCSLQNTGWLS